MSEHIGFRLADYQAVYMPDVRDAQNTYIVARSGAGKTELTKAIAHHYIQQRDSCVIVIEPSGKLASEISRWPLFHANSRLVYFYPDLFKGMMPCINPFDTPYTHDHSPEGIKAKRIIASELKAAFSEIIAGAPGTEITGPMGTVLDKCILTLLEKEGSTFHDLIDFMAQPDKRGIFPDKTRALIHLGQSLTYYERLPEYFSERFRNVPNITKFAIVNRLDNLVTGKFFGEITCRESTINLEELIALRKIIVFNLSKGALHGDEGSVLGRLIVALVQSIALRRDPNKKNIPIHLILDEVQNYASSSMETILGETRKYELYLTAIQTTIGGGMSQSLAKHMKQLTNVKIMGQVERDVYKEAQNFVGCEPEEIATLQRYQFYMSVLSGTPVRFKYRVDFLNDSYSMTNPSWELQKERQLKYYRKKVAVHKKPEVDRPEPEERITDEPRAEPPRRPLVIDDDDAPTAATDQP